MKTIEYFKQIHESDSENSISMMKMMSCRYRILSDNLEDLKTEIKAGTIIWKGETFGQMFEILSKHFNKDHSKIYQVFDYYRGFEDIINNIYFNYDKFNLEFIKFLEDLERGKHK